MGKIRDVITKKLINEFRPMYLEIIDDSHKHQGHMNAPKGIETHFTIIISSKNFEKLNLIASHRLINNCLSEELTHHIHALSIKIKKNAF